MTTLNSVDCGKGLVGEMDKHAGSQNMDICVTSSSLGKPPSCIYYGEVEFCLLLAEVGAL